VSRWDRTLTYGLGYAMVVMTVPLGLWMLGLQRLTGRDYVLNLSSAVVVCALAAAVVLRRGGSLPMRWVAAGAAGVAVAVVWAVIGVAHHGPGQTAAGLRIIVVPIAMIVIVTALPAPAVASLLTLESWLVVANAAAGLAELAIGPARLVQAGFSDERNVRYINGVFRVPGLTEFNAELGMLAGAYLLGYLACWMTPGVRPVRWSWHAGALSAAACLMLSTSRSGVVLVVAGLLAAVLRRRSALSVAVAGAVVVATTGAFAVLGAAGSNSLFERFAVWGHLLRGVPPAGFGIGGAGAATYSRVAGSAPVFVDNYFLNLGLQFGPVVMGLFVVAVLVALVRLVRGCAAHPGWVMPIALLAGTVAASLVIDSWEFPAAMLALFLFCAHGLRAHGSRLSR
jgi:hypothetical protein